MTQRGRRTQPHTQLICEPARWGRELGVSRLSYLVKGLEYSLTFQ